MKWVAFVLMVGASLSCTGQSIFHQGIMERLDEGEKFPFGVASGDPRQDRVVLWTKVVPTQIGSSVEVDWAIATDTNLTEVVGSGTVRTDSSSAFTVHLSATGLKAGTTYYYRFKTGEGISPTGRTRTAPDNPDRLRFAVASCSNYPAGYFNAYGLIAQQPDIDAVIHLGDYIYENGTQGAIGRGHIPPYEILTLSDYRSRYAQYRLDPDLLELHRLHPFIVIWDDHEIANNCYAQGAPRHDPKVCEWNARRLAAKRAYFEWLPVENPEKQSIVRSFNYGGLADLFMIDGRMEGRTPPIEDFKDPARFDPSRSMLGEGQTDWLTTGLRTSQARWKILGNNVMFSPMDFGKHAKERQRNMDGWDGYPTNRDRIFDTLQAHGIRDLIVITGDIHTAWGIELARDPHDPTVYDRKAGKGVVGAEFVTPSISSTNLDEQIGKFAAKFAAGYIKARKRNPHVRYANLMDHGFMLLELVADRASVRWIYSKSVKERTLRTRQGSAWHILHGGARLLKGE
ncbi:MAG: alkaline phosphatase D family protein [Flavobacteriales bacterium]|nr:alkaline phosphatase D family protein [Flavobacteriales bacterium]